MQRELFPSQQPPTSLAFVNRPPSDSEFENFRLALSTFQDGSGQNRLKNGRTLPGLRDFERTVADVFNGNAPENKGIFDVLFPDPNRSCVYFGASCKMSRIEAKGGVNTLTTNDGRVRMEIANSPAKFWAYLQTKEIYTANYKQYPKETGACLIELIQEWHANPFPKKKTKVDLSKSSYLTLSWDNQGLYQLHWFSLQLPDPNILTWRFEKETSKALRGIDRSGTLIEWYGESGGQLKYYPLASSARWASPIFRLEPLDEKHQATPSQKAAVYFSFSNQDLEATDTAGTDGPEET